MRGEAVGVPHRELFWRSGASRSPFRTRRRLEAERERPARQHPEKVAELEQELAAHDAEQEPSISRAVTIDKDLSVPEAADDEYIYWSN